MPYSTDSPKTNVEVNRKYADFDAVETADVGHFIMLEKPQEFRRFWMRLRSNSEKNANMSRFAIRAIH